MKTFGRFELAKKTGFLCILMACFMALCAMPAFSAGFNLGDAQNYGILFEGNGANSLQITNVSITGGNIGVGLTGKVQDNGPSTVNGSIDFSAAATGQYSNCGASCVVTGGVNYSSAKVTSALATVNALNTTLGGYAGKAVNINGSTTINASSGTLNNGVRTFSVGQFNTTNNDVLTINGSANDLVVLNFTSSTNFNNQVALTGGITSSNIIYNFVGGSNLTGGPTLQINDNGDGAHPNNSVSGIFLNPNGAISITNTRLTGQVFGGDTHDFQYVSGTSINVPGGGGNVPDVPEPASLLLLGTGLAAGARKLRGKLRP